MQLLCNNLSCWCRNIIEYLLFTSVGGGGGGRGGGGGGGLLLLLLL